MAEAAPSVQVIVVAFNSAATLARCIDALCAQTFTGWEAVVWDNASADGAVEALGPDARIGKVRSAENLGFAAANNRAAALSRSDYIVLLNPDAFPEPDWLERLVAAAERHGAESVASLQLDDADPALLDGAGDCMSITGFPWRGGYGQCRATAPTEACEVFSACGAAALYRREAFERLGGLEERFFCYCEDVDLGYRIRLAGGRCVLEPTAVVRHIGGASSGGEGSDFAEFHGARNRLWTFVRNTPWLLMPIAAPAHALLLAYVLLRSPRLLRVRLKGLRDALRDGQFSTAPIRRPADLAALLASLSWSPLALSRRNAVNRPLKPFPKLRK